MFVTLFWAISLLVTKKNNNKAKVFLGVFMTVAFVLYFSHAVFFHRNYGLYLILAPIYTFCTLSVFPLYYLYSHIIASEEKLTLQKYYILVPAIFFSILSFVLILFMSAEQRNAYIVDFLYNRIIPHDVDLVLFMVVNYVFTRITFIVLVIISLIKSRKIVKRYNIDIEDYYSDLSERSLHWLQNLLNLFGLTAGISILFNIVGRSFFADNTILIFIPAVIFTILLFTIGLHGYNQNFTISDFVTQKKESETDLPTVCLNENEVELYQNMIYLFENEMIYRTFDLKIEDVAKELCTNRSYISRTINNRCCCSFNTFVNRYRVKEAKKLLMESNTTILGISEQVGFNSTNTFNRVFKSMEKMPPGQYRRINNTTENKSK